MYGGELAALIVFAVTGSLTPGPNNAIATVTGANHGLRATLPHVCGVPFGFSTMLIAGGLGAAALITANPPLASAVRWTGVGYLLYIAWSIASADSVGARTTAGPLTFWQSAAFQYANPKAWMLAAATAGTYMASGNAMVRVAIICAVFSLACAASLVVWACAGAALSAWLKHGARPRVFNLAMGALLAATAIWMALE